MEKVEINCDENRPDLFNSEKQYDNYLLIGGLKLLAEDRQNVKSSVIKIRNKHNIHTGFKIEKSIIVKIRIL